MDINEVIFSGRLGKDPLFGKTQSGKARTTAALAVNSYEKTQSGEETKVATWFTLVAWDKAAEMLAKLKKGMNVYVRGSMKQRKYTKEGVEKEYLELTVRHLHVIDSKAFGAPPDPSEPGFSEVDATDEPPF